MRFSELLFGGLLVVFCVFAAGTAQTPPSSGQSGQKETGDKQPPARTQPAASGPASKQTKPSASSGEPAGPRVTPQPVLPPILHDFTSLLEASTNIEATAATAAQLKNIVAFVSSDKNHSYVAIVKTLAPDYAIVTNPVPAGETAISVLIGNKDGGRPSISTELSSTVKKNLVIAGDFSAISKVPIEADCSGSSGCAVLLSADGETIVGQVQALEIAPTQLSVTYTAPANEKPASIRLQNAAAQFPIINLVPPAAGQSVPMRQVIAADFCQKNENDDCTTDFFKPDHSSSAAGDPHSAADPKSKILAAGSYVLDAGNSEVHFVQLNALGLDSADVSFSAPASFKPAYLVLDTANQSYRFAYTPAPPSQTSDLNYESDELSTVCDQVQDPAHPADPSKTIPDCDHTAAGRLSLKSLSNGSELGYVAIQGNLVIARVTAPLGQEAYAITVTNKLTKKSTIARRTTKPGEDTSMLNVGMSIMDQMTAQRNYGNRIAKRYIAVTLDVYNPTPKKVQFNKSAMYFDVDYVEAREQGLTWPGFWQSIGEVSTLGLYQPSVYGAPFVAGSTKKDTAPRVARFGLEQNVRQAPENYLSVLGSFDYTTTKTDDKLKALELIGSVLTTIATGGIVADASGAFRAGTTVFASTFLPGVRSIALDTSFINRLRSNLVAQTLQDTIQVPSKGSTTTIVLLPRTGILSFTDAQVSVMIKRIIDVHLVTEVVSEVTQTPIKKNECSTGNSKDQTRQALGEPTGVTTNPDGTSLFTFSRGPVATVNFDKTGTVTSCSPPRTPTEQMDLDTTLLEAKQTLTDLGLNATLIPLTDGSTVIVDIPGISKTYHFKASGDVTSAYTFLFKEITAEANKANETQATLETFLEDKATLLSASRSSDIKAQASKAGKAKAGASVTYGSPDIQK
ncbi:MAG: hypothetical protein ACLPHP_08185 [Candidatus Sulfotelmatobacter sp.]